MSGGWAMGGSRLPHRRCRSAALVDAYGGGKLDSDTILLGGYCGSGSVAAQLKHARHLHVALSAPSA